MRNVLSIDQSLAKCAVVVWNDNVPVFWDVFKSGGIECKKKLKSVTYFEKEVDKIDFISDNIISIVHKYNIEKVILEGLALNAVGNATRSLAGLYYVLLYKLKQLDLVEPEDIVVISPTQVKSKARLLMENNGELETINDKGKAKKSKIKMDKQIMTSIAEQYWPQVLDGYKNSGENAGKEDLSDACLIYNAYLQLQKEN
ncbi:hypothetical protein [Aeromonas phage 4L372D]|uniref:Uncharacterized protein n=2 Tax=Plateaulakevirus TaxID=2843436 RepID=A0A5B9N7P7_9CAUD|nr:hypothetical protein HWC25_gp165 [Aeromonas phage 2L372D]YP_009846730.1 hypothetical protein HWC27_gp209 [Aeromonas phage 4L372D]QDB74079.1 hypothetical protein 2L372D_165 [Aeromonas phage 2L372D]QEG08646.1 hypothetical protein [Aeromonas phage 4L372D]